jgi:hypothetical protein
MINAPVSALVLNELLSNELPVFELAPPNIERSPDPIQEQTKGGWRLERRTNRGAHGEVWRGSRVLEQEHRQRRYQDTKCGRMYVLKRMLLEKGEHVRLAAAREVWFNPPR